MFRSRAQIEEALTRTGRCLALADAGEHALLVCGGSALNLAGLLNRPTRDVDVLGLVKGVKAAYVVEELLPEEVTKAAERVAWDLNLPNDWLNDSALEVHRLGLPAGILRRANRREYGPCLTVYVIGRQDQVALKLYAAIDAKAGQRHFKDLAGIEPTLVELDSAVHWLLDRETSAPFRRAVSTICAALGFGKLPALAAADSRSVARVKGRREAARQRPRRPPKAAVPPIARYAVWPQSSLSPRRQSAGCASEPSRSS